MTSNSDISAPSGSPGLVTAIFSCVFAVLAAFIPFIGWLFAIVGLVLGLNAHKAAKRADYQPGLIFGLIGAIVSGITLVWSVFATLFGLGALALLGLGMAAS